MSTPRKNGQSGRIAIITADGTEDQEFFYPYYRFLEAGYQVDVLTPDGGKFKGKNGGGLSETDKIGDAQAELYGMLYIPGGKAPERLKKQQDALDFVRDFCATGKPVGAICHGPQLLAAADVISGKSIAAYPECEKEVQQAGATFVDQECAADGQFITARFPKDLPAQMSTIMERLQSSLRTSRKAA